MPGLLLKYDIICSEIPSKGDLHSLLAYNLNVKLAELFVKYYRPQRRSVKTLESWINEYDGTRIRVLYTFDDRTFEEMMIDWLFSLRDLLIAHKIDLNAFRYYVADIASLAAHRNPELYKHIKNILLVLGCELHLHGVTSEIDSSDSEHVLEMLKNVAKIFDVKPNDFVGVTIKVMKQGKPCPNAEVKVVNIVPGVDTAKEHSIAVKTNTDGVVRVPARKFSILKVNVKDLEKTLLVGDKDGTLEVNLYKPKMKTAKDKTIRVQVVKPKRSKKIKYIVIAIALLAVLSTVIYLLLK